MLNIASIVSPILEMFIFVLADHFGRRKALILLSLTGLCGASLGTAFRGLAPLTVSLTMIQIFYEGTLNCSFIYLNELIIDPLRSKSVAMKSLFLSLGTLSESLIKAFSWIFKLFSFYPQIFLLLLASVCLILVVEVGWFHESPMFLSNKQRFAEAEKVLNSILDSNFKSKDVVSLDRISKASSKIEKKF